MAINAPRVWHELGINGAGTIVDSGDRQPLAGVLVRDILGLTAKTTGAHRR